MSQNMATAILAHKVPQVGAETHICCCTFAKIPLANWESFEKEEAFPINQVLSEYLKAIREVGKREV